MTRRSVYKEPADPRFCPRCIGNTQHEIKGYAYHPMEWLGIRPYPIEDDICFRLSLGGWTLCKVCSIVHLDTGGYNPDYQEVFD